MGTHVRESRRTLNQKSPGTGGEVLRFPEGARYDVTSPSIGHVRREVWHVASVSRESGVRMPESHTLKYTIDAMPHSYGVTV